MNARTGIAGCRNCVISGLDIRFAEPSFAAVRWSFRIARVLGIEIRVHVTFLLLLLWIGVAEHSQYKDLSRTFGNLGFILLLFGVVVLHELGHAMAARMYGIPTRRIMLLPIGGVAELERMPSRPWREFVVAVAGPAVNVLLAGLTGLLIWTQSPTGITLDTVQVVSSILLRFFWVNIALAVFNMLPAFPMDGGRVLRALLHIATKNRSRATDIAAGVGKVFALLMGWIGLNGQPVLILIAIFIWFGGGSEASLARIQDALRGLAVRDLMQPLRVALAPHDSIPSVVGRMLAGHRSDFLVVDRDRIVGILRYEELLKNLADESGNNRLVHELMEQDFEVVNDAERLDQTYAKMMKNGHRMIPVVHHTQLVGVLCIDTISEFLMLGQLTKLPQDHLLQARQLTLR